MYYHYYCCCYYCHHHHHRHHRHHPRCRPPLRRLLVHYNIEIVVLIHMYVPKKRGCMMFGF